MKTRAKPPESLRKWGKNLWKCTMNGAHAQQHDLELLETACRSLDRLHICREQLAAEGLTVKGRYGQPVAHPLVEIERIAATEFRACLKLLGLPTQIPERMTR